MITSSTSAAGTPARSKAAPMATVPRSDASTLARPPLKAPTGVRAAPAITTSVMFLDLPLLRALPKSIWPHR